MVDFEPAGLRCLVTFLPIERQHLVPEMAHAGHDHGQAGFVRGCYDFRIAHGATGLDHRRGTGFGCGQQTVGEGEEGVRGNDGTFGQGY